MDLTRPMSVVTPTVDGDALAALALADAWFTPGRLHRSIGRYSEDGIRRALRRLVDQGIVEDQSGGNATLYRLNRQHLAAPAVVELAGLRGALTQRMAQHLTAWPTKPKVAAIFGSAARGTMTAQSDIDIFVVQPSGREDVQDAWAEAVSRFEHDATRWTGNDTRVLQMTEAHVRAHAGDEPVLEDVLEDGVRLTGDLDWLRRLVRLARSRG